MKQEDQVFNILPCQDLQAEIAFFTRELNVQLDRLYPAEQPKAAELSGHGLSLLLDVRHKGPPARLLIRSEQPREGTLCSPGGTELRWERPAEAPVQRIGDHRLEISTLRGSSWVSGRAGTHTRDLIPSRLGGGIMASHIRIPNGGPVRDRVHYHTSEFQLIYCVQGWIRLIYEDQGDAITLQPGDCVTQPPHIRHRVLETSNGLEVLELGMPAEHVTAIDNEMSLPNGRVDSHRLYHGQRFCHYRHLDACWKPHRLPGLAASDTGVADATLGMAGASLLKAGGTTPPYRTCHRAQLLFSFVITGSIRINRQLMVAGDAFTMPPDEPCRIGDISPDVTILEVSVPGAFETEL